MVQRTNVITASGDQVNVTGTIFTVPTSFIFQVGQSGMGVQMSGQGVEISGQQVEISGQYVKINSGLNVVVQSGVNVVGNFVTSSSVSGQPVALVSGTALGLSGLSVQGNFTAQVSGQDININPPMAVRIRTPTRIPNLSGGVTLISGVITRMIMESLDGDVYIGGTSGVDMPYSGYGIRIGQYDRLNLDIGNFNLVNVFAIISGSRVSYGGVN